MSPSPATGNEANTGALRRTLRRARRTLDGTTQQRHADAVARHVAASGVLHRTGTIGLYLANHRDGELDTRPLLHRLWAMKRTVACPVIDVKPRIGLSPAPLRTMSFYRLAPDTATVSGAYGLAEPLTHGTGAGSYVHPLALAVLFMPLVGFDAAGQRLGMGAGYYDRFLGRMPETLRPLLVGLAHEAQRAPAPLSPKPWDIPLDAVVTEAGWQPCPAQAKV